MMKKNTIHQSSGWSIGQNLMTANPSQMSFASVIYQAASLPQNASDSQSIPQYK